MQESVQYATFRVANLYLGVQVAHVQEVMRHLEMTSVALAPPTVEGLINLRGDIITAINLRARLGLPPLEGDRQPVNVVLRLDDGLISMLVDEISDVLEVTEDTFEPPPETLDAAARELILGAHKLDGRLLLVLDTVAATSHQMPA